MAKKKTHWLFGHGPNKELYFKEEIDEETSCRKCFHVMVCDQDMSRRCVNYEFGRSDANGCHACIHHYTRWDKDAVPCFVCKSFVDTALVQIQSLNR